MQRVPSARHRGSVLALAVALASGTAPFDSAHAQQAPAPVRYDTSLFKGLQWRNVGPNRGGRSTAVAGSAARPNEYYFGATGGGLWKTTDGGNTWKPVTDGKIGSSSVGSVGVCESNPDVVYVGMGETELRGNIMQGDGVYKTTDAGKTWQHVGLENTQAIAKIRVLPGGCDNVVAAVFGHPYGKSAERGVYRSTDGGKSWKKTLYRNDGTGAIDVVVDQKNPQVMYASLWDSYRTSWMLSSGGPGGGIFKSTDGGETWKELTRNPGLPKGIVGKIGLSVSPADPNRVYAVVEAEDGGLFRSDDAGATWTKVNDERKLRQRAFYYSRVFADPKDKDVVYVLNVQFWKSTDGGKTFPKQLRPPHGDNHDLWIASNDPQRMIEANDGGGTVSVNGGETWTEEDYPTAQLYHIAVDNRKPYFVCGAQQDNSTVCMPSKGWGFLAARGFGAAGDYFYAVGGGESGYIANSPADPDIYYAGSYGGLLTAYDHSNGQERAVNPWPDNPMGYSSGDIAERFQWTFPIVVDPLDPKTIYAGSQHLMRTTNGGQSWETISPDLTRHDPKTLGASGGPITKDQTGVETYATIFSIAPSPVKAGVIWTGSDDGFVQVTQDGGKTWANVTPKDLPPFARIQMVEASPRQPGRAYVAASRYQSDDLGLYAYRTDDFGKTWTKITNGIRPGDFVRVVREDPVKEGLLYAGTEHGIYLSFDDGASWQPFGLNLPDAQVPDILTHEGDIVIATHGRSAYILDGGAAFLRQLAPVVAQHDVHLFEPTDATRSLDRNVAILYNLKQPAKELTVDILDAQGNVVRSFKHVAEKKDSTKAGGDEDEGFRGPPQPKSPPNKAGLNRFTWDLRYPGPVTFPKLIMWAAGTNGPKAPVGTYQVRLTADGNAQTQSFAIVLDPRVEGVAPADIKAQFDFAMKIRDRASEANEAVIAIRDVKDQVADRLKKSSDAGVKKLADAFTGKISGIEQEIYQVRNQSNQDPLNFPIKLNNKIAALQGVVESADARPTDQSLTVFNQLSAKLQVQLDALKTALGTDLPRLNQALQAKGLAPVEPPSPEKIRAVAEAARDE